MAKRRCSVCSGWPETDADNAPGAGLLCPEHLAHARKLSAFISRVQATEVGSTATTEEGITVLRESTAYLVIEPPRGGLMGGTQRFKTPEGAGRNAVNVSKRLGKGGRMSPLPEGNAVG